MAVTAEDRSGLERILRYGLRPPFAEHRLEEGAGGEIYYRLRKQLRDGRTQLLLDPVDLLRRLAAFVPPKGQNPVRYHGVFAPNSKHRSAVARLAVRVATRTLPEGERGRPGERPAEPPIDVRPRRIPWADLLNASSSTTSPPAQSAEAG